VTIEPLQDPLAVVCRNLGADLLEAQPCAMRVLEGLALLGRHVNGLSLARGAELQIQVQPVSAGPGPRHRRTRDRHIGGFDPHSDAHSADEIEAYRVERIAASDLSQAFYRRNEHFGRRYWPGWWLFGFETGALQDDEFFHVPHAPLGHVLRWDLPDRRKDTLEAPLSSLPLGAFVKINREALLVWRKGLMRWSFSGYSAAKVQPAPSTRVRVLTPGSVVRTLAVGFRPNVHPSANG
jgi:hypothetical protein